ncbi:helix-turn-helix domain-containing protein [Nocardioides marmoribigeumensis]|uniref:AcrR family transcriptional regulator n=1 Tax=Nocardioides marmoribigeumensis TaxID=433649 RepID=A0ABU2BU80_9ACTN|nr:helix-turn-helix domain-containing protein [Nocardioides marmoribigeumensis]MDR7360919.1 AcrR family transcriptional regulator [Nocardioides marmoribigeumensis]
MQKVSAGPAEGKTRERVRPTREDVRARVLGAAAEVFLEHGYHQASTTEIASRAGFTKGALYSNFGGKEDLFLALVEQEATARVEQLSVPGRTGTVSLDDLVDGLLGLTRGDRAGLVFAEFRAAASQDRDTAARVAVVRRRLVASMAARLAAEVAAAGLALAVPAEEAATVLVALVNGLGLEQVGAAGPLITRDTLLRVLSGLVTAPEEDA